MREARGSDAAAIARIAVVAVPRAYEGLIDDRGVVDSIVAQTYGVDALRDCIEHCRADDASQFLVAVADGNVVGFLHYEGDELHRIYVETSRLRLGIGSALLAELHRLLSPSASYVLMVVAANEPAVTFYRRHGLELERPVDGVAHMREHMGVAFPAGTAEVPALILRYTKGGGS